MARRSSKTGPTLTVPATFAEVLEQVEPRPDELAERKAKKNYAEALSNRAAVWLAAKLRKFREFHGILPNPDGTGRETRVASGKTRKPKKTDVRFSTADTGLELLVSVKTYSFRDPRTIKETGEVVLGRYSKNMVRNDHELRAEAMDLHERFPYAVVIGVMFIPFRACDDAKGKNGISSFAAAVMTFRARAGRRKPTEPNQLLERMFIALYESEGPTKGEVYFFDVEDRPPRQRRPASLKSEEEFIQEVVKAYGVRNKTYIEFADEIPGAPLLQHPEADEDAEGDDDEGEEDHGAP
ncbi:MAG: hypothetical protein AMXMBFR56_56940 [Polyangiaceae bacterium]